MKNLICTTTIFLFFNSVVFSNVILIHFEPAKSEINTPYLAVLDSFAADVLSKKINKEILIEGHTDIDGSNSYNKALAMSRARAVKLYLESKGLKNRFSILSKGENIPIVNQAKTEEKYLNRRVEVKFVEQNLNTIFSALEKKATVFSINPHKDTTLHCPEGTKINIPKKAFAGLNPSKRVLVKVTEYYSKADFIKANLTTNTTTQEMLESRGMIYIEASQGDKKLALKPETNIGILFKDRKLNDGTETFYGVTDQNNIAWESREKLTARDFVSGQIAIDIVNKGSLRERIIIMNGIECRINEYWKHNILVQDTVLLKNQLTTSNLFLESSKLGWINCDRFYKNTAEKIDFVIQVNSKNSPAISLVFEDINSIMPYTSREDNKYYFKNIPIGMKVKIIGLYQEEGQTLIEFAQAKTTTSKSEFTQSLKFKKIKKEELKL